MKLLCFIIAIALPTLGFKFGTIWERAALRIENVSIQAVGTEAVMTGTLTRSWNGLYHLFDDTGGDHVFTEYRWLEIHPPQHSGILFNLFSAWRMTLPVISMTALAIILIRQVGYQSQ